MSQNNLTLEAIGILDTNIHTVGESFLTRIGLKGKRVRMIPALLTYPLTRCPDCGKTTLVRNGTKLTHVPVPGPVGTPVVLALRKQRWLCRNCGTTVMATTSLVDEKRSISNITCSLVMKLCAKRLPVKTIADLVGVSETSVQRIICRSLKLRPALHLPKHLSFDEFRSTHAQMAFICIDSEKHRLVTLLGDRFNQSIKQFFINRYSLAERMAVETVCMDMNAAYQVIIKAVFPNARIIIDRFHIVQLVGRALDDERIKCLKSLNGVHSRQYKALKTNWRLLHKTDPESSKARYRRGINEYLTDQQAVDLGIGDFAKLRTSYETYQALVRALADRDARALWHVLADYQNCGTAMDTAVSTLEKNLRGVLASTSSPYSNGPIEGINRLIKSLSRSCFGFRNQMHLFIRIFQLKAA